MKNFIFLIGLSFFASCSSIENLQSKINAPKRSIQHFKSLWSKNFDPKYLSGNVPIHLNGFYVKDNVVYLGGNGNGFFAISEKNGRVLWNSREGEYYNSSPLVYQDSVIYGTESGRMFSRNILNGKLNYEVEVGASVDGDPIEYGGRIFVQLRNHQIFCLDGLTGKILWSYKKSLTDKTSVQRVGRGIIFGNNVFFGFADGDVLAFRIETGDVIWEKRVSQGTDKYSDLDWPLLNKNGSLVAGDGSGFIHFMNFKNGEITHRLDASLSSNLLAIGEELYFGDTWGNLNVIDSKYQIQKLSKISKRPISRMGIWKDNIIASDIDGTLYYINRDTFKLVEQKRLGIEVATLFSTPVQGHNGGLVVFTNRGRLYYFQ